MSRQKFNDGQEILFQDLDNMSAALERTLMDNVLKQLLQNQTNKIFGNGFKVSYVDANTVAVAAGVGVQQDLTVTSPEPRQRLLLREASSNHDITTPDSVNNRIDVVSIKAALEDGDTATRKFKDAGTDAISNETMVIRKEWEADIVITAGTPAGSPVAPATPTGYIKIAEVLVTNTTGISGASAVTDFRPRMALNGYNLIVGSSDHCTHTTLALAILDASEGDKILVENDETINTTVDIDVDDIQIDFKPNVTFTKGSATKGLSVNADGVRINGGRFAGFSGGSDVGIEVVSGADYAILFGQRFNACTTDVSDLDGTATILANVTE